MSERSAALILLGPMLIFFTVSIVYPFIETIRLGFYDIRGLSPAKWIGFGNYHQLFADPDFRSAMVTTLYWTFVATIFSVVIGWVLAILCSFAPRATLVFRIMIFSAYGVSEVVSGFIWLGILQTSETGLLNTVLINMGLMDVPHPWLGDVHTALWALIVAYAWTQVGLPLMICFASIRSINNSILEAAYIDGASVLATMRHIIMPLSLSGVRVAIFINLLASLRAFDMIFILTGGGPVRSTETVGYFMFRESMAQFKLGYGAAATIILLIAVLIVSIPAIAKRTAGAR